MKRSDEAAWDAFVVFAPYAYDASAWSNDGQEIVNLADSGTTVIAALTPEQAALASDAMGLDVLVPLNEWRKRRRRMD